MSIMTSCGSDSWTKTVELPDMTGWWGGTTTPINTIPTTGKTYIELGPIAGGTVEFQTLTGSLISKWGTASDGALDYNPRDIISKIGNDQWIVVHVSGGQDTDVNDDGVEDIPHTPLYGSFRMLIPRVALEKWEKIIVNPRAGIVSEMILSRNITNITIDWLDQIARQSGAIDQNNDGLVDYRDLYSIRMKDVSGVSKVVPAISGYIDAIHNGKQKTTSLENVYKTENHIIKKIVSSPNTTDHTPALELSSSNPNWRIYYTLDLSSPVPGGAGTYMATGKVVIPFQNAKLYYREEIALDGKTILWKVAWFDLTSDWTELSAESVPYNGTGKLVTTTETTLYYKDVPYNLIVTTNAASPGYTYPKTIWCQVWATKNAGCDLGPYMVWSVDHEVRVRALITSAVESYVDNPNTTTNLVDTVRNKISYNGATYTILNTWTSWTSNKRTFPVRIDVTIFWSDKTTYDTNRTVNTQSELDFYNQELERSIKEYIDSKNVTPPAHTQNQVTNYIEKVNPYYGGWYQVLNKWNLDGKGDYPVKIIWNYAIQTKGTQTPLEVTATNDADRIAKSNQMILDLQSLIQAAYNDLPKPNYPQNTEIYGDFVPYRNGYGYQVVKTMNLNGNSDYPASIRVEYTTPLSSKNKTATLQAKNAEEMSTIESERILEAKGQIDLIIDADQYPPNAVETLANVWYGEGSYRIDITYSKNVGQDYPAIFDIYVNYRDGSSDHRTLDIANSWQKVTYLANMEAQARSDIDNSHPLEPVNKILSDGPYSYGNKGSEYTFKVKYNRTNTGTNYPALVWIEYRSRSNGNLMDTRVTYGNLIANNSVEKEQMKSQLEQWVKWQIVAMTPVVSDMMYATNWDIRSILFSQAYAATAPSSILVKNSYTTFPDFTTVGKDVVFKKFLWNGTTYDHYVKRNVGSASVAGSSKSNLALQIAISGIKNSSDKINQYWWQCTVWWELNLLSNEGCSQYYEKIRQEEIKIQEIIWKYFYTIGEASLPHVASTANYMYGLWDGATVSMYAMADVWLDIIDWEAIHKIGNWYTTKMYPYFYENSFDFKTYYNDGTTSVIWLSNDVLSLFQEVIGLETDPYRRWYLIGSIWATVGVGKILGTTANAAIVRMKALGQLVATVEKMPSTPKQTQLLNALRAKMVQEGVVKFNSINTVEDIQAIAKVNTIPDLTQKAYVIIGTEETAQWVINFLKNKNWKFNPTDKPTSSFYTSPDWIQQINFRTIASSEVPGYQTRVTFDLLRLNNKGKFEKIPWNAEVKFVFPNK